MPPRDFMPPPRMGGMPPFPGDFVPGGMPPGPGAFYGPEMSLNGAPYIPGSGPAISFERPPR